MSRIFISYRRSDTISESGRIHDHLEREFGGRNVFKDVDDIQPGVDFRKVLDEEVATCDVLLVIIGDKWVTARDAEGNLRLADPDDFVRIEVESGLKRDDDVLVIPVLVNGAPMPTVADLPESLHELTYRNAVIVRNDPDFNRDMRRLIDFINRYRKQHKSGRVNQFVAGGVVAVVLAVIALLLLRPPGDPVPPIVTLTATDAVNTSSLATAVSPTASPETGDTELAKTLTDTAQELASNGNYDEAIDTYTRAIDADPTYTTAYFGRALAHSSGYGDWASAITDLEQAIMLDSGYAEAFSYLGRFYYFEGVYEPVESTLERAIELNPNDIEGREVLAEYYVSIARYDEASEQYQAIIDRVDVEESGKLYDTWVNLAYTREASGDISQAIEDYQTAIDLDDNRPEAYAQLGNLYTNQADYSRAQLYLEVAIEKNDDIPDADTFYNRGLVHLNQQNYSDALDDFNRAIQLDPNKVLAYVGRGRVYSTQGDYVAAVASFSQAIDRDVTVGDAYYWRGLAHYDEGQYDLAIADFTDAIQLQAMSGEAYGYRGLAYLQQDHIDLAQDDLNTAIDFELSDKLSYQVLVELGSFALDGEDASRALAYFEEAIVLQPENPIAYQGQVEGYLLRASQATTASEQVNILISGLDVINRVILEVVREGPVFYNLRGQINGQLANLTGDQTYFEEARNDFEIAIGDETYADAHYRYAQLLVEVDARDALGYAERAYALDNSRSDIVALIAEIYVSLGDNQEAQNFYQIAIEKSTDEEEQERYQVALENLSTTP